MIADDILHTQPAYSEAVPNSCINLLFLTKSYIITTKQLIYMKIESYKDMITGYLYYTTVMKILRRNVYDTADSRYRLQSYIIITVGAKEAVKSC